MKKLTVLLMVCGMMIGMMYADGDVTSPGDAVIGVPNNNRWPGGEAPQYAIDNDVNTKYLHFRDQESSGDVGIIITPSVAGTVVQGITLTTANDASGRDPIEYALYGSNSSADVGPWTPISSGPVVDFIGGGWPRFTMNETPIIFPNENAYNYYRLMFPDVQGGITALFQIAEIELLEKPTNGWAAGLSVVPTLTFMTLPEETELPLDLTIDDFDSESWTIAWTQVSGPAAVTFDDTAIEDPTVTFPAVKGNYVLQVDVTDAEGNVSTPKQVKIRLWDPAVDEQFISHWTFDVPDDTKVLYDDAAYGDDNRGYLGNYNGVHQDPNFVPGWVSLGGELNNAIEFTDAGYVEVYPDANTVQDPNLMGLDAGVSVASWVYATDWSGNRRVLQYGNNVENNDDINIFRMLHEWGELKFDTAPGRVVTAGIFPSAEWHHMAGTYDGYTLKLYIDGILVSTEEYETYLPMRDYVGQVLTIGAKNKLVNYESYPGDYMNGKLDDIRIYSYAIDQDAVRSLVALGQESAPGIVSITAEDVVLTGETVDVPIDAEVFDAIGDTINYEWTQQSPTEPAVVFDSTTIEDPTVTFSAAGTYVLRLTIDDGVYGTTGTIYQDVTIVVSDANCEKVKLDGLLYSADLTQDCYVNIDDFAEMALQWLNCNDPQDPTCDNPYQL